MSTNKDIIVSAYAELNKFGQSGDYDRALKVANKILQTAPSEQKAFHCKVVCLIQQLNFKEALQALSNSKNAPLVIGLYFEKAYTQYRLNYPKEALETVDSAPELTPALKELRAQILYRLEQYQECYNIFRDIVKNTNDDYEDERKTNLAAVVANLAGTTNATDLPDIGEGTYELCYNAACKSALTGQHAAALPVLKRAEQACSASILEDGGTEDEVNEEVAIIRVQQAYCQQMLGQEKEAAAIYHSVLKSKPSDQALVAIASNNLVVINKESNVFDSRKRIKAATQDGLEHKLNSRQRKTIAYNQAILAIYSNQPELCKQCCGRLAKEFGAEKDAVLVEACSLQKEGKSGEAVTLLSKGDDSLKLAAVQMLLAQGDRKGAIRVLEQSGYMFKPAVIGALVTIYCADNEFSKASDVFKKALDHYKDDEDSVSRLANMWRAGVGVHERAGAARDAAACLSQLARAAPADARALARLVRALAAADPDKARELSKQLPPVEKLEGKIDIDALESSKWMMGAKVVKKSSQIKTNEQSPGTPSTEMLQRKNKNRKRKKKLPPNADLSRPPDPERWLPKHERTAFRKRRGGNRRDIIKGSQGMTTAATDQYDMTKHQPSTKSPRITDKSTSSESAWQRKQAQKKKGKGKKW